jgi:hypothetical protein
MPYEQKLPKCFGKHRCWTYRQKRCSVEFACLSERDARLRVNNPLPYYSSNNQKNTVENKTK